MQIACLLIGDGLLLNKHKVSLYVFDTLVAQV